MNVTAQKNLAGDVIDMVEERGVPSITGILGRTIQGRMDEFFGTGDHAKRAVCEWCERIPPDPNAKVRILVSHL